MNVERFLNAELLRFPGLAGFERLAHAITTKPLNMAPHRHEGCRQQAIDYRRLVCEHLGLSFDRLTAPDQIHSHHVLRVTAADVGAGRVGRETAMRFVDGLVCDLADTPIIQLSGDCPILLIYDPRRHALGTAHASWRGTVAGMATQLVARLSAEFGCNPLDMHAGLAPCAGVERYEVGPEVRRIADALLPDAERFFVTRADRLFFDMKAASAAQLIRSGVPASQIEIAPECTISDPRFFSHRREGPSTGRFGLIAGLLP